MKQTKIIATSIIALASASLAFAASEPVESAPIMTENQSASWLTNQFGIGAQVGIQGIGLHLRYDINEQFNLRLEGNYFEHEDTYEVDGVDYDGEVDFSNVGLLANWLPFAANSFRVTGGVFGGALQFDGNAGSVGSTIELDNQPYTLGADDRLVGSVEYNSVVPYLGVGWDFVLGAEQNWILGLDVGILFMGDPEVTLVGTGTVLGTKAAQDDINAERVSAENDLEDYTILPVVKISVTYRF